MDSEIMKFILGGGGVALLAAVGKLTYDWIHGRVMKEESAVAQWQGIARSRLDEIHRLRAELDAYKRSYSAIWRAYTIGPPPGTQHFPFIPSVEEPDGDE